MNIKQTLLAMIALFSFSIGANAAEYNHSTPAIQGYDAVSYQTGKRPIRGNGNYVANYKGATYQFSSKDNLDTFNANPEKYTPAYGGYCAFGASVGKKFIGDPEVWRVVDGKLYLNLDTGIQEIWVKDISGNIKAADKQWKTIKNKSPSSL